MSNSEKNALLQDLAQLKQDHRDLDISIQNLSDTLKANEFEVKRLKREKLKLKDSITRLESKLIPDLHA